MCRAIHMQRHFTASHRGCSAASLLVFTVGIFALAHRHKRPLTAAVGASTDSGEQTDNTNSELKFRPPPAIVHPTSEEGLPGTTATDLAVDTAGFVWLGTDSGLARWDGTHLKDISSLIRRLPTSNVTAVEVDPTNGVWIAAGMLTYVSGDDLSVLPTTISRREDRCRRRQRLGD